MNKLEFISKEFPRLLRSIDPQSKPVFGKMNPQQMIEHMSDSIRWGNGKDPQEKIMTPEERIVPMQDFLRSEKEFRPNTKNALMGEEPLPVRNPSMADAISELEEDIRVWIDYFRDNKEKKVRNPFFGDMDFNLWTDLLYKHAIHHLKQFNVEIPVANTAG